MVAERHGRVEIVHEIHMEREVLGAGLTIRMSPPPAHASDPSVGYRSIGTLAAPVGVGGVEQRVGSSLAGLSNAGEVWRALG